MLFSVHAREVNPFGLADGVFQFINQLLDLAVAFIGVESIDDGLQTTNGVVSPCALLVTWSNGKMFWPSGALILMSPSSASKVMVVASIMRGLPATSLNA